MQVKIKVHHLQIQEKVMTNIVIYLTCQEMQMNGLQNTLLTPPLAASTLVFIVEGITMLVMAEPAYTRLTVSTAARLTATATIVCVPYFM